MNLFLFISFNSKHSFSRFGLLKFLTQKQAENESPIQPFSTFIHKTFNNAISKNQAYPNDNRSHQLQFPQPTLEFSQILPNQLSPEQLAQQSNQTISNQTISNQNISNQNISSQHTIQPTVPIQQTAAVQQAVQLNPDQLIPQKGHSLADTLLTRSKFKFAFGIVSFS